VRHGNVARGHRMLGRIEVEYARLARVASETANTPCPALRNP
jgi:hypothetical protein